MKLARWALTGVYALLILYLSTSSLGGEPPFPHFDKLVHFVLYGGLSFLCAWSLGATMAFTWKGAVLVAFLLSTAYGVANEILQMFIPPRSMEFMDALANAAGALLGAALAVGILWRGRGRRRVNGEAG